MNIHKLMSEDDTTKRIMFWPTFIVLIGIIEDSYATDVEDNFLCYISTYNKTVSKLNMYSIFNKIRVEPLDRF